MNRIFNLFRSSIGKKQIVATTGLALILYLIGHLAGNLFIYGGPDALNGYAQKLSGLRPGLYFIEFGLLVIFLIHIYFTALVVLENINARKQRYAVFNASGHRSFATRIMPFTGTLILVFVIYHLLDFTFIDHHGSRSILPSGEEAGLYGVVYNAFTDTWHSLFYIAAMMAIGFHLSHGLQSFFQTFGLNRTPQQFVSMRRISNAFGILIAVGYSTIPLYVMWLHFCYQCNLR